jgi:phosphoglycerate dehydrogenase-like enzyme
VDKILRSSEKYLKTVNISNTKGVYAIEIAEHTMALLLMMHRELHLLRDAQHKHEWRRSENLNTLNDKNVLILGYGNLGKHIADKLKVFGVNIFGVTSTINSFDGVHWKNMLCKMDFVILALPDTPQTDNMLSRKELDKLSSSSIVINIGRAQALDQKHLLMMLKTKKIRGAALDVFTEEPLPKEHSAWDIPNLFISPHTARSKETDHYKYQDFFELNFKTYVTEGKFYSVVDKTKGY